MPVQQCDNSPHTVNQLTRSAMLDQPGILSVTRPFGNLVHRMFADCNATLTQNYIQVNRLLQSRQCCIQSKTRKCRRKCRRKCKTSPLRTVQVSSPIFRNEMHGLIAYSRRHSGQNCRFRLLFFFQGEAYTCKCPKPVAKCSAVFSV